MHAGPARPARPAGEGGSRLLPLFVLLSGLAVSILLFGVTFMLVRSRLLAEKAGRDLEDANRELEATNRELEAFSYSVSHDLRAPLRSIDGFSQILVEDYADEIDEEGRGYLGRGRGRRRRAGRRGGPPAAPPPTRATGRAGTAAAGCGAPANEWARS